MVERIVCKLIDSQSKLDRECSYNNFENKQSQRTNMYEKKSEVLLYKMNKHKIIMD